MQEINEIHTETLEWGCVNRMIDRIAGLEEKIEGGWDSLIDVLADLMEEEYPPAEPEKIFYVTYQFVFRLYYRIKANPVPRKFNMVDKNQEGFRITNYDYETFKWAMEGGFVMTISNDYIDLPIEKLSTNQVRALERRAKKEE